MKKLILVSMLPLTLLSSTVFANDVDAKAAYGDALEFVAIKLLIATIVFYLLTYGLINKPKDTAIKSARWFASILATFSIIAFPHKYEIEARNFLELALSAIVWCVIGCIAGYLWFKFKQIKNSNADINNVESYANRKVFLLILALIGIGVFFWYVEYNGMGKVATYDAYTSCKDTSQDCTKSNVSSTFKVDKEKSEVIAVSTSTQGRGLKKLDNCVILDKHNWQCTDNPIKGDSNSVDSPYSYTMTDDEITMSDSYLTQYYNGKFTTTTYYGFTFVKR